MSHHCNLSRICACSRHAQYAVMLYSLAHAARKTRFICYMRFSGKRTSNQDGLLSDPSVNKATHYPKITVSINHQYNVQNVHCSVVVMQHTTSVWIHIMIAKHTPDSTVSVLFKGLFILDLKRRGAVKWSNCAKFHALCTHKKSFSDTKVWKTKSCRKLWKTVHNSTKQ